jgi:hypothetical protein
MEGYDQLSLDRMMIGPQQVSYGVHCIEMFLTESSCAYPLCVTPLYRSPRLACVITESSDHPPLTRARHRLTASHVIRFRSNTHTFDTLVKVIRGTILDPR